MSKVSSKSSICVLGCKNGVHRQTYRQIGRHRHLHSCSDLIFSNSYLTLGARLSYWAAFFFNTKWKKKTIRGRCKQISFYFDKKKTLIQLKGGSRWFLQSEKTFGTVLPPGPEPTNEFSAWFNSLFQILVSLFN